MDCKFNIKRLHILSAAREFIYSLEMKELKDLSTKIREEECLFLFFSLQREMSMLNQGSQSLNTPTRARQNP